jgi:hypothetical protein
MHASDDFRPNEPAAIRRHPRPRGPSGRILMRSAVIGSCLALLSGAGSSVADARGTNTYTLTAETFPAYAIDLVGTPIVCTVQVGSGTAEGGNIAWWVNGSCTPDDPINSTLGAVLLRSTVWDASGVVSRELNLPDYRCTWQSGDCGASFSISGNGTLPAGVYDVKTILVLFRGDIRSWLPPTQTSFGDPTMTVYCGPLDGSYDEIDCTFEQRDVISR